jgi:outer membrane protein assembly factor BamB
VWVADASQNGVYRVSLPSGRVLLRRVPGPPGRTIVTGAAVGAGAVWVTSADARELVRLDVNTGSALFHAAIGAQCGQVAFGAGAAWVACGDGTVWRVDGETNVAKATHLGGVPTGVAVAGDHVWVTIR